MVASEVQQQVTVVVIVGLISFLLTAHRLHVPPMGTPRQFRPPQPPPRQGGLAEVVHLPAGPKGGAATAPPRKRRPRADDKARVNVRQPRQGCRLTTALQLPPCISPSRSFRVRGSLITPPITSCSLPCKASARVHVRGYRWSRESAVIVGAERSASQRGDASQVGRRGGRYGITGWRPAPQLDVTGECIGGVTIRSLGRRVPH